MHHHKSKQHNINNNNNNTNYNHVVNNLQDYMFTCKVLVRSLHMDQKTQTIIKTKTKVEPVLVVDKFFTPEQKDSLFWCYFIIKNGFAKYEFPNTTSYVNEKTEKFKCIQLLRDNKQQLKIKKIKNIKEDVEDELANKECIGMKTFIALCVASNINIMYIHKRKCFEAIFDEDNPIYVIHCTNSTNYNNSTLKYCYEHDCSKETIDKYKSDLFKWESVDKPLKAISSYKSEELVSLCKKLEFTDLKKKTKKELYEMLVLALS